MFVPMFLENFNHRFPTMLSPWRFQIGSLHEGSSCRIDDLNGGQAFFHPKNINGPIWEIDGNPKVQDFCFKYSSIVVACFFNNNIAFLYVFLLMFFLFEMLWNNLLRCVLWKQLFACRPKYLLSFQVQHAGTKAMLAKHIPTGQRKKHGWQAPSSVGDSWHWMPQR